MFKFTQREIKNTYKLKYGTVPSYISIPQHQVHFYGLAFEKGDWQYILSVDKGVADTVTPEVLVEIANSFESDG